MKRIWMILTAMLLAWTACPLRAQTTAEDFVRTQGTRLVRGAQDTPYYYIGAHAWYAPLLGCTGKAGDRDRLRTELDSLQALGVANVRVLAGVKPKPMGDDAERQTYDWDTDETDGKLLRGLDYLMAEAAKRGLTVTICLTPKWRNEAEWQTRYAEYVRTVVGRTNSVTKKPYREDAALLAWQLCDEAVVENAAADEAFTAWVRESAALIKSLDGNHLVSVGLEGAEGCHGNEELYQRVGSDDNVDLLTVRLKPLARKWASNDRLIDALSNVYLRADEYLADCDRMARKIGKPYVIDAFGYPRDAHFREPATATFARDAYFGYVITRWTESREAGGTLVGASWMGWGGSGRQAEDGSERGPRNYLAEYPQQKQGAYSVYDADSSTLQVLRRAAQP